MNVEYLIQMLGNRLNALGLAKEQAFGIGDLEQINKLDIEVYEVQNTLAKLKLLQIASQEVMVTNNTLVESMTIAADTMTTVTTATNGSLNCLNEYDIEPYATDPLHEQKIADILSYMGSMDSAEAIDAYINSEAISSPVTGAMVLTSAQAYAVDARLMLAIMEQDSRFGTAGIAIATLNPGNVGNTGMATRTYASWADGVAAVAEWLSRHRKTGATVTDVVSDPQIVSETQLQSESVSASTTTQDASTASSTPVVSENQTTGGDQTTTSTQPIFDPASNDSTSSTIPVASDVSSSTPDVLTPTDPVVIPDSVPTTPEVIPTGSELPVSEPLSLNLRKKGRKGISRGRA